MQCFRDRRSTETPGRRVIPILGVLVVLLLSACDLNLLGSWSFAPAGPTGPTGPPPPSTGDSITIVSISPPQGDLVKGSDVTFTAIVSWRLASADSGLIHMIIRGQNGFQTGRQPAEPIAAGSGTLTLTDTITIPAQGVTAMQVFLELFPRFGSGTSRVVRYGVR